MILKPKKHVVKTWGGLLKAMKDLAYLRFQYEVSRHTSKEDEETYNYHRVSMSNTLHTGPKNYNGWTSLSSALLTVVFCTDEHCNGRTKGADEFYDAVISGKCTDEELLTILKHYCEVVRIKKSKGSNSEHSKITAIQQKYPNLHWMIQYALAGIPVVERVDLKKKEDFIIDGFKYESIKEIAEKHSMSDAGIRDRFKNPNFPTWIVKEKEVFAEYRKMLDEYIEFHSNKENQMAA